MYLWLNRLDARPRGAVPCGPGWLVPAQEAVASALDRGFLLGDGLFETMLVRAGRVPHLHRHLRRFTEGTRLLGFPPPPPLEEVVPAYLQAAQVEGGVLRLTYSRGPGPRGYRPPQEARPLCLLSASPPAPGAGKPWRAVVASYPQARHPILSRVKHTSSLPRIVAAQEAAAAGADEALFCTPEGWVAEGTATNVFWVRAGTLFTPGVDGAGCLPGVARAWVLEWAAAQGLPVREGTFPLPELSSADEAFLTNAIRGPVPLKEVSGGVPGLASLRREWGQVPGPVTARAMAAWEESAGKEA